MSPCTCEFRFYEELNDYLPAAQRKTTITREIAGTPSVKDAIESLGVPHTEIDLILVDGTSVRFDRRLRGGERIAVYPEFERFDITQVHRLRPKPLRRPRFVADVHLGTLARYLRLLGFDTRYGNDLGDAELAELTARERRVLLTCDVGLLKRKVVVRGQRLRSRDPEQQVEEVVAALQLTRAFRPFTRCMLESSRTSWSVPLMDGKVIDCTFSHGDEERVAVKGAERVIPDFVGSWPAPNTVESSNAGPPIANNPCPELCVPSDRGTRSRSADR